MQLTRGALVSPDTVLLILSQLLVPSQHLQDQLLLSLRQETQVDHVCSLGHGAFNQKPFVQVNWLGSVAVTWRRADKREHQEIH